MPVNDRLPCPRSVHSIVFREFDKILRADPVVRECFKVIRSWTGADDDAAKWGSDDTPGLAITPSLAGDEWYGPSGFENSLAIDCEIAVSGTNFEDAFDLVQVVRRAIYPVDADARQAIRSQLVAAGSPTGEPLFGTPGVAISQKGEMLLAVFQAQIEVENLINT